MFLSVCSVPACFLALRFQWQEKVPMPKAFSAQELQVVLLFL